MSDKVNFGVKYHIVRLILKAKKYENFVNFIINLKYKPNWKISLKKKQNCM